MSGKGEILFQIDNLCKAFGSNLVLDHISTEIKSGEVVVIVGPSGSGKSTFLRSLNLLEMPTSGTITFEGMNITDKKTDINKYRQKIGMVFQHFNLFPHKTILENLTLAPIKLLNKPKEEAEKEAREWDWKRRRMPIRHSFPADRNRELPLSGLWRCIQK